jgi:hypothetical protein
MSQTLFDTDMTRTAILSDDGRYRMLNREER